MMIQAVLGNPNHPEYGVATIPFPIPRDQYAHCIDNALEKITEHLANARSQLAHTTEQLENARTEMTAPFPKEAELAEKTRRLNELNVLLNLNEQDRPVMADEPDEGDRIRPKNAERER